uniref:TPR_REGION domain-containing protein n=1 Tax=Macrostomum lignano TaxID=282301 RepID=A0A1I8HY68_9PLAT
QYFFQANNSVAVKPKLQGTGDQHGTSAASPKSASGLNQQKCLELALEGEQLCKAGEHRRGQQLLLAALNGGIGKNRRVLSAVYSQLGNAYFHLGEYERAFDYHTLDLGLARSMSDKLGEAKASGNLATALKAMGSLSEAVLCCERQLELSKDAGDEVAQCRAHCNLASLLLAQGKRAGRHQSNAAATDKDQTNAAAATDNDQTNAAAATDKDQTNAAAATDKDQTNAAAATDKDQTNATASNRHQSNAETDADIGGDIDLPPAASQLLRRSIEHYRLGLDIAQRLKWPRQLTDTVARAWGCLGNAQYLLGELEDAIASQSERLALATAAGDLSGQRRAHCCLGNAKVLAGDLESAKSHYAQCLGLAAALDEPALQAQACWLLGNACTLTRDYPGTVEYHERHLSIADSLGDRVGACHSCWSLSNACTALARYDKALAYAERYLALCQELNDTQGVATARLSLADLKHLLAASNRQRSDQLSSLTTSTAEAPRRASLTAHSGGKDQSKTDQDAFLDLVSRCQSRRMDDQRATAPLPTAEEAFLDALARWQGCRLDDQRACLGGVGGSGGGGGSTLPQGDVFRSMAARRQQQQSRCGGGSRGARFGLLSRLSFRKKR